MKKLGIIILSLLGMVTTTGCDFDSLLGMPEEIIFEENNKQSISLVDVYLDSMNVKKEFFVDETFTYDGLKVIATYSDNSKTIYDSSKLTVTTPDMNSPGNKTVNVKIIIDGYTKRLTYSIVVKEQQSQVYVVNYSLDTHNAKLNYTSGEGFSSDGLVLTIYLSDGSEIVLTGSQLEVIAPRDMINPGTKEVIVQFTYNGYTYSVSYGITVSKKSKVNGWTQQELNFFEENAPLATAIGGFPYIEGMSLVDDPNNWYIKCGITDSTDVKAYFYDSFPIGQSVNVPNSNYICYISERSDLIQNAVESYELIYEYTFVLEMMLFTKNWEKASNSSEFVVVGLDWYDCMTVRSRVVDFSCHNEIFSSYGSSFCYALTTLNHQGLVPIINEFFNSETGIGRTCEAAVGLFQLPEDFENPDVILVADDLRYITPFKDNLNIYTYCFSLKFSNINYNDSGKIIDGLINNGFLHSYKYMTDYFEMPIPSFGEWEISFYATASSTTASLTVYYTAPQN